MRGEKEEERKEGIDQLRISLHLKQYPLVLVVLFRRLLVKYQNIYQHLHLLSHHLFLIFQRVYLQKKSRNFSKLKTK